MKKKLLSLTLVAATVFGLAGCGVEREGDIGKAFDELSNITNGLMTVEMIQKDAEGNEEKMIMTEEIDGKKMKSSETMVLGEDEITEVYYTYEKTEDDERYDCYVFAEDGVWEEECYPIYEDEETEDEGSGADSDESELFFNIEMTNESFEYKKGKYYLKADKKADLVSYFFDDTNEDDVEEASFVVVLADGKVESMNIKVVVKDMGEFSYKMTMSKLGKVKVTLPEIEAAA